MVIVDREKCAYCGSCVSVCPVGAIELAETRLEIDECCSECWMCINSCPVGALRPEGAERAMQALPRHRYDVVVVGAGPGGSVAARVAAEAGLSVLLVEKRQEVGSPVRCAEGIGALLLPEYIESDPCWISAEIRSASYHSVNGDQTTDMRFDSKDLVGYVLERRVFDRMLAERAVAAGAQIMVKTPATGLLKENGRVVGVLLQVGGDLMEVDCSIVIGADGVESWVGRWAGLDVCLPERDSMPCAQFLLAGIDIDPSCMSYFIGDEIAPGGYAWIFPKGGGRANVGLGVQADKASMPAVDYLRRFVESRPHLAQGSPVTLIAGNAATASPPASIVAHGCALVGDAARQLDPLTGGGIPNAMLAGKLAAETIVKCIERHDVSAGALADYQTRWQAAMGKRLARNYHIKERFESESRTDRDFLRLFIAATGAK